MSDIPSGKDQTAADFHMPDDASLKEKKAQPEGFADQVENLKFMKVRRGGMDSYLQTIDQIREMAKGGDPEDLREQYYKGWVDTDFADLLREVGETQED